MDRSNGQSFEALLTPHRSLSRQGFLAVMGLVIAANFIAGLVFFLAGAWPIALFAGLDVLIVWWAFKRNFNDARQAERVALTPHELVVHRHKAHRPVEEWRILRRNLRIELEEDRERELIGRLFLRYGPNRLEIGQFLSPDERKSFAAALQRALLVP
jgi:uncharacterized membrane protein